METDRETCQRFANEHKLIFEDEGEVGFGRPCVGFLARGGRYLDYNPGRYGSSGNYEPIEELHCQAAEPPDGCAAYHKHNCMAVLGHGDRAVAQLAAWVRSLESQGRVEVVDFETGATSMQALISGLLGYAVMVRADIPDDQLRRIAEEAAAAGRDPADIGPPVVARCLRGGKKP